MGGSSGGGDSENTVRYAPYLEEKHQQYLNTAFAQVSTALAADPPIDNSDFDTGLEESFFASGFAITDFTAMFNQYGTLMSDVWIEALFDDQLKYHIESPVIKDRVDAMAEELEDELTETAWPTVAAGLRDINSVMSSSFITTKGNMESKRLKAVATYDAELRAKAINLSQQIWQGRLEWNKSSMQTYMELFKLYYSLKMDLDAQDHERKIKYALWPFTILEYERLAVGVLSGAMKSTSDVEGPSQTMKTISGVVGGAAMGAKVGGGYGAIVGGVVGGIASFF